MLLYVRQSPRAFALVRNNLKYHGVRFKKRNSEVVPHGHDTSSNTRSGSNFSKSDPCKSQRTHKYPSDASSHKHLIDPEDCRFHSMQRIPSADSLREFFRFQRLRCKLLQHSKHQVLFQEWSEDLSDYLFGELRPNGTADMEFHLVRVPLPPIMVSMQVQWQRCMAT